MAIAAVLVSVYKIRQTKSVVDLGSFLKLQGYDLKTKEATFRNHKSQKITGDKAGEHFILLEVKNVNSDSAGQILDELLAPIIDANSGLTISNPYSGTQTQLSTPKGYEPIQKSLNLNGVETTYYRVFSNEIYSLRIFSATEAKYEGVFAVYYCTNNNSAYRFEVYNNIGKVNEESALETLKNIYCE